MSSTSLEQSLEVCTQANVRCSIFGDLRDQQDVYGQLRVWNRRALTQSDASSEALWNLQVHGEFPRDRDREILGMRTGPYDCPRAASATSSRP